MSKFTFDLEVPYFACNPRGYMTPTYILNYFGEASSAHSDYLGLGVKELVKDKYGWVLNRWKVEFIKYPRVKDKLRVETWTSGVNKFYANREFVLYDEENQIIVKATTVWIFLNIEKQRPIRIPKEIEERYNCLNETIFNSFYKFKEVESIEESREYFTRKSDIDYNNHVNNVKYLDWILELIPDEVDKNYSLNSLEIQYRKEILHGNTVISNIIKEDEQKDSLNFSHSIYTKGDNGTNTYARTSWKRK